MNFRELVGRLLPKRPRRPTHPELPAAWTTRDWADLPTFHPRRDEDALH